VDGYNGAPFDCVFAWKDSNEWLIDECDNLFLYSGYTVEYDCT
jgi:hypothetical protein